MKDAFDKDESKYSYNINLDYGTANPFKKLVFFGTGSSIGTIIVHITLRLVIGAATDLAFIGVVYIAGITTALSALSILLFVPGLLGIGIYELYRWYKNKNVKDLYEGLKDQNNEEYALEREIYYKTIKEFESLVYGIARSKYQELYKKKVIEKANEIIQRINCNNNQLSDNDI